MTNKEYITNALSKFNVTETDVDMIILNQGLNATGQVEVKTVKLAMYKEMSSIIPVANISEGGLSISWNMDALKVWYMSLCAEIRVKPVAFRKTQFKNLSNKW